MEAEKKPKITLDEILATATGYQLADDLSRRNHYASDINAFGQYLKTKGISPGDVLGFDDLGRDPGRFSIMMNQTVNKEREDLASKTESILGEVVTKLNDDALMDLSFRIGIRDKTYSLYMEALQNKDAGLIRNTYEEKNKDNGYLMMYAESANAQHYFEYAQMQVVGIRDGFMKKNFYEKENSRDKDGNPIEQLKYSSKKAQDYLLKTVSGFSGDKKKEALIEIGMEIAKSLSQEKIEKAKKAKAAESASKK